MHLSNQFTRLARLKRQKISEDRPRLFPRLIEQARLAGSTVTESSNGSRSPGFRGLRGVA